jgi:hypothetical protein|tara:strand:- start:49 stop:600 length:552 start_codon:yes stop_codon:yes gene_type:complete
MECLKVSFLSNMFGFKSDKETNHSIDFKQINSLVEDFISGKLTGEALLSFPRETSSIVMLAIRERSLLSISGHIILRKNGLYKAYIELNRDSKHELLHLYFSPSLETEESIYLRKKEIRDASFIEFLALIEKDGLSISALKKEYLSDPFNSYDYLLPLYSKLNDIPDDWSGLDKVTALFEKRR